MARDFDGVNDEADGGTGQSQLSPTTAITVFAWHNPNGDNAISGDQALIDDRNNAASNQNGYVLQMQSNANNRVLRFFIFDTAFRGGGTFSLIFGTLKACGATWNTASGDIDVFCDGVVKDTFSGNTSAIVYTNAQFAIGRSFRTGLNGEEFCNAIISFGTIWAVKLADNLMAVLNRGVYPMFVSSVKPVGHFPLWGNDSPEDDYTIGNANLTLVGTTKVANPPIQLLSRYMSGH